MGLTVIYCICGQKLLLEDKFCTKCWKPRSADSKKMIKEMVKIGEKFSPCPFCYGNWLY